MTRGLCFISLLHCRIVRSSCDLLLDDLRSPLQDIRADDFHHILSEMHVARMRDVSLEMYGVKLASCSAQSASHALIEIHPARAASEAA